MDDKTAASAAPSVEIAMLSIDDIDAVKLGETPHEFEYVLPDGRRTGVYIQVYGSQTDVVQNAINAAQNKRRAEEAANEALLAAGGKPADFRPVEDDIEFGKRLAAIRIAGWRGLKDKFTFENALRLCKVNADLSARVVSEAGNIGNFMRVSLPRS